MTRYEAIEKALREIDEECGACHPSHDPGMPWHSVCVIQKLARKALALPEDSKTVNAELYGLAMEFADEMVVVKSNWSRRPASRTLRYLELREASGEPMPYKVVRDGDKVRFDVPDPPKDGE